MTIYDLVDDGHTIGALSYDSNYTDLYIRDDIYLDDLEKALKVTNRYNRGGKTELIRFYGGSGNKFTKRINPGVMSRLIQQVSLKGLIYVDWNVDSGDSEEIDKDTIVDNVIKGAEGVDDICVRLHDGRWNKETVLALPEIISILKSKGYKFRKLTIFSPTFHQECIN